MVQSFGIFYNIADDEYGFARMYGYVSHSNLAPKALIDKYENSASKFWNDFYKCNTTHFFKDRHWLVREFPELGLQMDNDNNKLPLATTKDTMQKKIVLECGCGVGNSLFPLLDLNPNLVFYSFDFSPYAIQIIQHNERYLSNKDRAKAFVYDIASTNPLPRFVPVGDIDISMLIFVLSAIPPQNMQGVVNRLYSVLKVGGIVIFRDYARDDLAQKRFAGENQDESSQSGSEKSSKPGKIKTIGENFYVRKDGTAAYFFDLDSCAKMFESAGFKVLQNITVKKEVVNRKQQKSMERVFIQGKYKKV
eukprot:TRINITY_DN6653_c0_g1_i2.p1 TRINITY_DN6653_c0_g1~~TRINITY_DN6653_c0_g1_i2.p1  ORF type:complete len:306 (+),score=65.67 TRINITY_DN6653_c0_g1_i2:358-1275(+)